MSSTRRTNLKSLDVIQITKIIPHRYPFLLVDKIIDLDFENKKIIGLGESVHGSQNLLSTSGRAFIRNFSQWK